MATIRKFFEKRKLDVKFKRAGDGHKLTEDTRATGSGASSSRQQVAAAPTPRNPTQSSQMAAQAALQRQIGADRPASGVGQGKNAIKLQVKREMEAEKLAAERAMKEAEAFAGPKEVYNETAPVLATTGVYFFCPLVGPEVLSRKEIEEKIHVFLLSQLAEEPEITSAIMIQTLNKDQDKLRVCIDTLSKYLDNIVANPGEEKYRKIRMNNKAFKERISGLEGTEEFMQAAGFEVKSLPGPNEVEESYYVLGSEKAADVERLKSLKEILLSAEPIRPQLDRNLKVFYPSPNAARIEIPPEFYTVSPEELKKEQQLRAEAVERLGMLRTKAMRERERLKELRRYRYCLIRVRFPDGTLLQGTFRASEKLEAVREFIQESLEQNWIPFELSTSLGQKLTEADSTVAELGLAPAAVISFAFDATVLKEVAAQSGSASVKTYLKPEIMARIQSL